MTIASKLLQRHVSREDNERLIEDTFKQLEATATAQLTASSHDRPLGRHGARGALVVPFP